MSEADEQEKQCRICLDGADAEPELGRLIRPCLCKGSISYVHVDCLNRWRLASTASSAFFSCPQCRYQYRFSRTRIVGLSTNPILIGGLSGLFFTIIVMVASFITTFFMDSFERPSEHSWFFYVSPFEVAQDLITAAFRVLQDGEVDLGDIFDHPARSHRPNTGSNPTTQVAPGLIKRLVRRFLIGLPLVGASSIVHMLLSLQMLVPVQWVARYRARRNRRGTTNDLAALLIVALLIAGAARALYQVYKLTERITQRVLLRAEVAILEVN